MPLRHIDVLRDDIRGGGRAGRGGRDTEPANTQAQPPRPLERSSKIVDLLAPRSVEMTIVAQDPTTLTVEHPARILTAKVRVPAESLLPGPRSHRFFVVDYDVSEGRADGPVKCRVAKGKFHDQFDRKNVRNSTLKSSHAFHAQNVFAIATRTLGLFEYYLGRRVPWAFDSHELFLVPNAQLQGNAYYDHNAQAVLFGYVKRSGAVVRTCLSHDIVAHEVTHAILDGLRPYYLQPGLPDQSALHEAFADLVALLSVFEISEVLLNQFEWLATKTTDKKKQAHIQRGQLPAYAVTAEALEKTVLFAIAEQLGKVQLGERAIRYPKELHEGNWWRDDEEYLKPHRRCEILVAAVMRTLRDMWIKRLKPLIHDQTDEPWLDLDRTVEEGARVANYLLGMTIRALDYLPPVDVDFADFLDAILAADEIVSPDDPFEYRGALEGAFNVFDIFRPETPHIIYGKGKIPKADYTNLNFNSLRHDPEEVYRFIWNNPEALRIDLNYPLYVNRVRATTRVGPDGMVVEEVIADYTQNLCITAAELPEVHPRVETSGLTNRMCIPPGLKPEAKVQLWVGGSLIFNQFGKLHLHQRKSLAWTGLDIARQQERIEYLVKHNHVTEDGSVGLFSDPGHALWHETEELDEESW
jgi:hypothetical protein